MRTIYVLLLTTALLGCSQLNSVTENDKCRRDFGGDEYCKQEKDLADNKPNPEGDWGLVFVQPKSLQVSLARRKVRARGCQRLAERYHEQSVAISKQASGKYSISGCRIITSDVYWKQKSKGRLWYVDAWVGVPINDTAQARLEKVRSTPTH